MTGGPPMSCPECGEDAVREPPSDLVPWKAHEMTQPEWSHRDGSSLCPVTGPSGGYQPADPQPRPAGPGIQTARLDPPASMPSLGTEIARHLAGPAGPAPQAGTAGGPGRRYMTRVIARLGDLHRQAEAEPEAGA